MIVTADPLIRPLKADDTNAVLQLLEQCLGTPGIPRTEVFWRWKHFQNPFGVSPAVVAESDGKIIALRVFMRWRWRAAGQTLHAVRAVDTVTHPQWQGRGLFTRLTTALLEQMQSEGVHFIYNTPNKSSAPGYLKMGWKSVTRLPLWFRPLQPLKAIRTIITGKSFDLEEDRPDPQDGNDAALPEILPLFEDFEKEERIHTDRTPEYLRWRFSAIPGFHYRWNRREDGDNSACVIWRNRIRRKLRELSISEILLGSGKKSQDAAVNILKAILRDSNADYLVAMAAKKSREAYVLRKLRFLSFSGLGPVLTVKSLNALPVNLDLLDWSDWRCSIADLEIF